MMENILIEHKSEGIVVITFNKPEALNALDLAMMRRFAQAVDDLSSQDDVRVLILTGAGEKAFCSGGDLNELSHYPDEDAALQMITLMGDALLTLERSPFPVIAAINGYALGGGSEIAVACDLRVVDENARLGFVQVKMGLTPGWGAGQRLMRLVGYPRAMDLLLRGHVMHAHELESLGLVYNVVEAGTALQQALNFAESIAASPLKVVRGIKSLLQAGLNQPYEQALQTERELFPPLWADEPHLQAVEAFLKRQQSKHNESDE